MRKLGFAAGATLLALLAATGARAQCMATGAAAGGYNLAPFALGGSINTLTSALNAANTVFLTESNDFIGNPANPQSNQSGGVWSRGIGGEQQTRSTATSTYTIGGAPVAGNIACQTKTQITFGGTQIGTDISAFSLYGWDLHAGSTLGYLGATGRDETSPGPVNTAGGTLNDNLQIPFAGFYGAATRGDLFVEGEARWLYIQNGISDSQNGLFNQHQDARGLAINGAIGYNFHLQNNWFVEPSAGFIWSETSVDPLNTPGTLVLGTGTAPPGTVTVSNIYSAIGRVSLKVGTTLDAGNMILQPFGTASFFREFEGDPTASFNGTVGTTGVPVAPVVGSLATTGLGNFGQVGLGLSAQIKDTGWLGYIRADYRAGDNIEGWNLNAGLQYRFSPEAVERPFIVKGPEPAPATSAPYNWTGLRVGASLGADWGYSNWNFTSAGLGTSPRFAGILPGGLVGYDYQIGKWVLGAGADMGWTNASGASSCPNGFFLTCENKADWLATVTGRVGYTYWNDRLLTYAKAGLALGNFTAKYSCNTGAQPTVLVAPLPGCPGGGMSSTAVGWTVGAGTEFALADNWSVRAETSYFDLGKSDYTLTEGPVVLPVEVSRQGYMATIGLAYRFDFATPAPLVAKY